MLIILLWSGLSLLFLVRLRVILSNLNHVVTPGGGWLRAPRFNLRPLRQAVVWAAELLLLCFLYAAFGQAFVSHVVASIVCAGAMVMMRERDVPLLEGLQIAPMRPTRA